MSKGIWKFFAIFGFFKRALSEMIECRDGRQKIRQKIGFAIGGF
jgi:hypothetical protein